MARAVVALLTLFLAQASPADVRGQEALALEPLGGLNNPYISGSPLTIALPTATGGNGSYTYALALYNNQTRTSVSAIPGVTFTANADPPTLSGTPSAPTGFSDSYTARYRVTDGSGTMAEAPPFLVVIEADTAPALGQTSASHTFYVDRSTHWKLPAATSGNFSPNDGRYALTLAGDRALTIDSAGLSMWGNFQAIVGTPQATMAAANYTLTVTDRDGETASMTLTLSVAAASSPDFEDERIRVLWILNQGPYRIHEAASSVPEFATRIILPGAGGPGTTYALTGGIPAGLSFDTATRALSGAPTQSGTFNLTLTATDTNSASDTLAVDLTVAPAAGPDDVSATALSCTTIELTWAAPKATILAGVGTPPMVTGYRIESKQRGVDTDWQVLVANAAASTTRYVHDGVEPKSRWEYRIAATTPSGMGAWSPSIARVAAGRASRTLEVGAVFAVTVNSPYGGSLVHGVQWLRAPDQATPAWAQIAGATDRFYEFTSTDIGHLFRVDVDYSELFSPLAAITSPPRPESRDIEASFATRLDPVIANEAPAFTKTSAEHSWPGGAAVSEVLPTATDSVGSVTYSLSPALPSVLQFDLETGAITGTAPSGLNYTGTLTARDATCDEASIPVRLTSTGRTRPPPPPPVIGGGGGGGRSGPTPSDVDFEWNVTRDIDELDADHGSATGLWSNGKTLWLANNPNGAGDAVYAYDLASAERVPDREFELDDRNRAPRGIWSDRTTVWVSDSGQDQLFAHDLASGERLPDSDLALHPDNDDPRGIWSDGSTMWVLDDRDDALFAYDLDTGELLAEYALDTANDDPHGLWSDGVAIWVSDHGEKRLFAYRLPVPPDEPPEDPEDLERVRDEEFPNTVLSRAGNNSPRGIWSDGEVMYVADANDDKVYTYNMPNAIDARLATLELSGVDFGEFSPLRYDYASDTIPHGNLATLTAAAAAAQDDATLQITPADHDGDAANGYQVRLIPGREITITVASPDGSRTRVYRVLLGEEEATGPAPDCLRGIVDARFSLVTYEGGSVVDLEACAEHVGMTSLYVRDEGEWVSLILGAPEFVNQAFRELYAEGVPASTPMIAQRAAPDGS